MFIKITIDTSEVTVEYTELRKGNKMENKKKKIEDVSALVYRTDDGGECIDVMAHHLNRPWLTVNITADSGAALIYDVAKAVIHNL